MIPLSRRRFLRSATASSLALAATSGFAQIAGDRPARAAADVTVINPRARVPVGIIIDDSTCLVNLNRFAMPQFDAAFSGANKTYLRNWREWPVEIPDHFVREFTDWAESAGVKGKFSIVPYPACVGRLDRQLPGWSRRELADSLELIRTRITPRWDIHPEMVTHTRVIDLRTGHPYEDQSVKFMENWEWTTGRSADEIAAYMAYALNILKNVGLSCEGVTTPGGFGGKALPQLAQASLQSLRDVFHAEIPHYFRHCYSEGAQSVAPRVEYAAGLDTPDPRCVVSIIGCTGDWTGGWDNTEPAGADKFITADLKSGRLVDVIERGEPALLLAHWTGIWWNGQKLGLQIFKEVVHRLHARYDHLLWMKLSEVSRYWAAKELTRLARNGHRVELHAPFACPAFTLRLTFEAQRQPRLTHGPQPAAPLSPVAKLLDLKPGTFHHDRETLTVCFDLPKGGSGIELV